MINAFLIVKIVAHYIVSPPTSITTSCPSILGSWRCTAMPQLERYSWRFGSDFTYCPGTRDGRDIFRSYVVGIYWTIALHTKVLDVLTHHSRYASRWQGTLKREIVKDIQTADYVRSYASLSDYIMNAGIAQVAGVGLMRYGHIEASRWCICHHHNQRNDHNSLFRRSWNLLLIAAMHQSPR